MIQKRYQRFGPTGVEWTEWRDYIADDAKLEYLQKEEPYQLKPKLRNEFRIV